MARVLEFSSVEDGATLRLTCPDQSWGSITAEAAGNGFNVCVPVYVDLAPSLPTFLDEIVAAGATKTPLVWETLEAEFRLEVTRDMVGHIYLVYTLRSPDIGSNRWWSFVGRLVLELGAMPEICKSARRFWRDAA